MNDMVMVYTVEKPLVKEAAHAPPPAAKPPGIMKTYGPTAITSAVVGSGITAYTLLRTDDRLLTPEQRYIKDQLKIKAQYGTIGGGALGGLLGYDLGDTFFPDFTPANARLMGAALGAVTGGIAGNMIGQSL